MRKKKVMNPAAGALVMAIGIVLYGAIEVTGVGEVVTGTFLSGYTVLSLYIFGMLLKQLKSSSFRVAFFNNPVQFFTVGTWIAGMSVLCNVWTSFLQSATLVVIPLMAINSVLCVAFLIVSANQLRTIQKDPEMHAPHGVLLLSTVAPQSVVIVWAGMRPEMWYLPFILVGLVLYGWSGLIIGKRYRKKKGWTLAEDWTNTNCIVHGALSITGLALAVSESLSTQGLFAFWVLVVTVFFVVETVELLRGATRVRLYGWKRGLLEYNISQWSRNFTFGMFYAFSACLFDHPLLTGWGWVVIGFLAIETLLFLSKKVRISYTEAGSPSQ